MSAIHRVRLGICNTYLIRGGSGYILVDAGNANRERVLFHYLERHGVSPGQIKLIVITHAHYDHVGSVSAIKNICGCPVAVHEREAGLIREGRFVMPPGATLLGKAVAFLGKKVEGANFFKYRPVDPDISVAGEMDLAEFGIGGSVIPTPGHTGGSVSVVLSTGQAFVGDLAVNFMGSVFPPFAENVQNLMASWRKLARLGVNTIFPAHGVPFSISLLKKKQQLMSKTMNMDLQWT